MSSGPDLFVVCKNCGSEVSPYITECPYCGTRLRKRAPKLDKGGIPKQPKPPKASPPRLGRLRRDEIPGIRPDRPWVTIALVGIPFVLLPVVATLLLRLEAGWILNLPLAGPLDGDYWRLLTYTLLYGSTGYELVAIGAIALFAFLLERRHGAWAPLLVYLACSVAGAGLAVAVEGDTVTAAGGNGAALGLLCAWVVWDLLARRRSEETDSDLLGVLVIAVVLILLPVADVDANWWVTLGGGLTGLVLGLPLAKVHRGVHLRRVPPRRAFSDAEIDAAVARLTEPGRLETAQQVVAHSAPQLQGVLNAALDEGGWFGSAHQAEVNRVSSIEAAEERVVALRTLIAEETRLSMLVGVAVGMELAHLLLEPDDDDRED